MRETPASFSEALDLIEVLDMCIEAYEVIEDENDKLIKSIHDILTSCSSPEEGLMSIAKLVKYV